MAGPVYVCACMANADFDMADLRGIKDSKQLTATKREEWSEKLFTFRDSGQLRFALSAVPAAEIDVLGIAPAIRRAIAECLRSLRAETLTTRIMLDGALSAPAEFALQETIIRGDEKVPLIAAASIIAKVARDKYMTEQALVFPGYGFERHKGYGTAAHCMAIRDLGISSLHRKSFLRNFL